MPQSQCRAMSPGRLAVHETYDSWLESCYLNRNSTLWKGSLNAQGQQDIWSIILNITLYLFIIVTAQN